MRKERPPFHLAMPMHNKEGIRKFYVDLFNASIGREAPTWIDIDFYGHQLSFHLKTKALENELTSEVDGKNVPVRHFGVILNWDEWHKLAEHVKSRKIDFIIKPYIRFQGETGEQATMFFLDPSGNALEFKSFKDDNQIFTT